MDRRDNPLESTTMTLQHLPPDESRFVDIPGRRTVSLPRAMYVLNGIPTNMPREPTVTTGDVSDRDVATWRRYERDLLDAVTRYAMAGTKLNEFYIEFGPGGYRPADPRTSGTLVEYGVTIVRVTGQRVLGFKLYPMNPNTGTRLVFE